MNKIATINITVKLPEHNVLGFEEWLDRNMELVAFKILPDTDKLYEEDAAFRKIVKQYKEIVKLKNDYINEHNRPDSDESSETTTRPF